MFHIWCVRFKNLRHQISMSKIRFYFLSWSSTVTLFCGHIIRWGKWSSSISIILMVVSNWKVFYCYIKLTSTRALTFVKKIPRLMLVHFYPLISVSLILRYKKWFYSEKIQFKTWLNCISADFVYCKKYFKESFNFP